MKSERTPSVVLRQRVSLVHENLEVYTEVPLRNRDDQIAEFRDWLLVQVLGETSSSFSYPPEPKRARNQHC